MFGGPLLRKPAARGAACWYLPTRFLAFSYLRLSGGSESRNGWNADHVCSSPAATPVAGGVVYSLLPYLNLTENLRCSDPPSEILMFRT